jgi:hypothetical protein
MAPGVAMQPIQPETPGVLSDVDVARQLATESALTDAAIKMAGPKIR